MQVIIEIPKFVYDMAKAQKKVIDADVDIVGKAIIEGTILPDNATNGDVLTTLFPLQNTIGFAKDVVYLAYYRSWWEALYKVGDTE